MWWQIGLWLVSTALSYVLRPKPSAMQGTAPKPAGISEFSFPTASESRSIPVLFGTRWISGPNVVWYGDLKAAAIVETACSESKW